VKLKVSDMSFDATVEVGDYTPEEIKFVDSDTEEEFYPGEEFKYIDLIDDLQTGYFEVIEADREDKQQIINGLFKNEP